MLIIGITGTLGAGKGTVVDYLVKEKGFKHYSVSGYLKEELVKRNLEVNRPNLQNIANELREKFGSDFITQKLFTKTQTKNQNAIIESIRNPKEAKFIKSKGGIMFAVTADQKIRYKRIIKRAGEKDKVTFEKFKKDEKREMNSTDPTKQNLSKCILMADFKFDNNGTINKLYGEIEKTIEKII